MKIGTTIGHGSLKAAGATKHTLCRSAVSWCAYFVITPRNHTVMETTLPRPAKTPPPNRLIAELPHPYGLRHEHLPEFLWVMLYNVEEGLRYAGATPGVDYSIKDLMDWTMPLVTSTWSGANAASKLEFDLTGSISESLDRERTQVRPSDADG